MKRSKPLTKVAWIELHWCLDADYTGYKLSDWHYFRKNYRKARWKRTGSRELTRAIKEESNNHNICDGMIIIIVKR